jgi:hypothetical protein
MTRSGVVELGREFVVSTLRRKPCDYQSIVFAAYGDCFGDRRAAITGESFGNAGGIYRVPIEG